MKLWEVAYVHLVTLHKTTNDINSVLILDLKTNVWAYYPHVDREINKMLLQELQHEINVHRKYRNVDK